MRQIVVLVAAGVVGGLQVAAASTQEAPKLSTRDTSLIKSFVAAPQLIESSDFVLRGHSEGAADTRTKPLRAGADKAAQPGGSADATSQAQSRTPSAPARIQSRGTRDHDARSLIRPSADLAARDAAAVAKSVSARDPAQAKALPVRNFGMAAKAPTGSARDIQSPQADLPKPARPSAPAE